MEVDAYQWGLQQFLAVAAMWTVMMTAMMLPSVLPWVKALSHLPSMAGASRPVGIATGEFLLGYF